MHEGCDRGGYYEQAQFAEEYGSPLCIVKLGCWGPVVQCNVGKRGWMGGIGGCPNVGGICIGCTMPGFPDKFMPFMNQPPGSLLSSAAVQTYGRAIHCSAQVHPGIAEQGAELAAAIVPASRPGRLTGARKSVADRGCYGVCSRKPMRKAARTGMRGVPPRCRTGQRSRSAAAGVGQACSASRPAIRRLVSILARTRRTRHASNVEAKYRALLEQIPAVVFMAYLDRGISEAYVSPEIEAALGYSREEWLEDPVRWYEHIHPDDKQRWSLEAAEMFLSGKPLRSSYRVIARDGRVVWFHCDARMVRQPDGQPWFIHGVAFDISDLKHTERALQQERNVVSGDSRYGRRAGHGSRPGRPHRALQPRLRIDHRLFARRSARQAHLGVLPAAGRGGALQIRDSRS